MKTTVRLIVQQPGAWDVIHPPGSRSALGARAGELPGEWDVIHPPRSRSALGARAGELPGELAGALTSWQLVAGDMVIWK
jgi:hypothetical protein